MEYINIPISVFQGLHKIKLCVVTYDPLLTIIKITVLDY